MALEGGYCLLSIESLKDSPSLPLDDSRLALLNAMPRNKLEEYCITPATVTLIADNKQDKQSNRRSLLKELWKQLSTTASDKAVISYGELQGLLNAKYITKKAIVLLETITELCVKENLPRLTYLAVNGKSELPEVLKKEQDAKNKFEIITK